ncbi:50S ribosomal protein L17 [Chloroflexota bacterium]
MRHKIAGKKLNRSSSHRRALYRNLVTELLRHEKLTITEAKAKAVRGSAEKMITYGKKGGLNTYRLAMAYILDEKVATKVFSDLAARYAERPGGYTRITKLGQRLGDGASMVRLELV